MNAVVKLGIVLFSVVLTACATTGDENSSSGNISLDGGGVTGETSFATDLDGQPIDPNSISGRAPDVRVIYFDFNKSEIRSDYLQVITEHGRYLAQNPSGRVRLEGHTDERGSREFNIALGEDRAKTIARMLQIQGVSSAQVRAVSYGEELPIDEAHSEGAWAKNRRVNIIYESDPQN